MLHTLLAYASRFKRYYTQSLQPLAVRYHFTSAEMDILLFLYNNPEYNTARDIVEFRGFAKSNVSTAVESLRRRGYLFSRVDPENRRIQRLTLSPAYKEQVKEIALCQERCLAALTEGFTPEERAALRRYLQRLDENVQAALLPMQSGAKESESRE